MPCSRLWGRIFVIEAPVYPSEASKLGEKEVSSTENMLAAVGVSFGTEIWEEVEGPSMWIRRGVSIWVDDRGNLLQVLRGGRTWKQFSSGVHFEGNGRGDKTGRLLFWGLTSEGCGLERVGNKGGEGCGMECEGNKFIFTESKTI